MGSTGFVRSITAKNVGALAVVCSLAGLTAAASASAGTLDQQQTDSDSEAALFETQSVAQTFTPDISGGLDQVDLELGKGGTPPGPVTVEIRNAPDGSPGPAILATASVPLSAIEETLAFVPVTFATPASVTAGVQYAIVAYSPGTPTEGAVGWGFAVPNPYEAGQMFLSSEFPPAGTWEVFALEADTAFKTYVAPPPLSPPTPITANCSGQVATQVGTEGNDVIEGTTGRDVIAALGGKDVVRGLAGNDRICGGRGKDTLRGGGDTDKLKGNASSDLLKGGGGTDKCVGGPGGDIARKCEVERST